MPAEYEVLMTVKVTVKVPDAEAIERVTGPGGDEWRSHLYSLRTEADVLEHWAGNAICNGTTTAAVLDGWADMGDRAPTFSVDDVEIDMWTKAVTP